MVLYLSTLESPSHKGLMCQVWLSGSRRRFFEFLQYQFLQFIYYTPFEKDVPFIWTKLVPFIKGCFLPSLFEIDPVVLEKMKMWNRQMYNGQKAIRKVHLNFQLRCAKTHYCLPLPITKETTTYMYQALL